MSGKMRWLGWVVVWVVVWVVSGIVVWVHEAEVVPGVGSAEISVTGVIVTLLIVAEAVLARVGLTEALLDCVGDTGVDIDLIGGPEVVIATISVTWVVDLWMDASVVVVSDVDWSFPASKPSSTAGAILEDLKINAKKPSSIRQQSPKSEIKRLIPNLIFRSLANSI